MRSTKMDACARICRHYLSRDDVLDVEFIDGRCVFSDLPPTEAAKPFTTDRKILIYSESPDVTTLLQNVSVVLQSSSCTDFARRRRFYNFMGCLVFRSMEACLSTREIRSSQHSVIPTALGF